MTKHETIITIQNWHKKVFPNATLHDQVLKWCEEVKEFYESKELSELADMVIVCAGIRRFNRNLELQFLEATYVVASENGFDMTELWDEVDVKMKKNRKRVWERQPDGTFHHINKED